MSEDKHERSRHWDRSLVWLSPLEASSFPSGGLLALFFDGRADVDEIAFTLRSTPLVRGAGAAEASERIAILLILIDWLPCV